MTVDKSLKLGRGMQRHRNVLSRSERILTLQEKEKWTEGRSVYGLPKVRVMKARRRAKIAAKAEDAAAAAAPGAAGAPAAAEKAPAAAAAAAAPAKGAKPAAKPAKEKK